MLSYSFLVDPSPETWWEKSNDLSGIYGGIITSRLFARVLTRIMSLILLTSLFRDLLTPGPVCFQRQITLTFKKINVIFEPQKIYGKSSGKG